MSKLTSRANKPLMLSELVAKTLAPVAGKRGFALANLRAAWAEVAGPRYADCTYAERIDWPRGEDQAGGALLRVRADGPKAVLLQHELGQLAERVNAFFGHNSVTRVRLVQGPVPARAAPIAAAPAADEGRVASAVAGVGDDALRQALARLGRGIFTAGADPTGQRR